MSKYWYAINIGIQNTLVYRVNFLFRSAFGLIPLMATIYLWRAVFEGKSDGPEVAGYTLAGMTSYYVLVTLVDMFTAVTDDDWQIAGDIRDGNINQFILKPIDYLTYRLCLFGAQLLNYTPFPYQLFFPVSIYLGRTTGSDLWQGLLIQAGWVLAFYLLARWTWSKGVRKYTAVGG